MPHHYPKSTVEASIWCNTCRKDTPWRIIDGRRQYCLVCAGKPKTQNKIEPKKESTPSLFGPETGR
jgi:hypothetical protein